MGGDYEKHFERCFFSKIPSTRHELARSDRLALGLTRPPRRRRRPSRRRRRLPQGLQRKRGVEEQRDGSVWGGRGGWRAAACLERGRRWRRRRGRASGGAAGWTSRGKEKTPRTEILLLEGGGSNGVVACAVGDVRCVCRCLTNISESCAKWSPSTDGRDRTTG